MSTPVNPSQGQTSDPAASESLETVPPSSDSVEESQGAPVDSHEAGSSSKTDDPSRPALPSRPQNLAGQMRPGDERISTFLKSQPHAQLNPDNGVRGFKSAAAENLSTRQQLQNPNAVRDFPKPGPQNFSPSRSLPQQAPQRQIPERPARHALSQLAASPHFRGAMAGSPLQQKIQQMAVAQQNAETAHAKQASEAPENFRTNEILQLFRMRHSEEGPTVKKLLSYVIAKEKAEKEAEKVRTVGYDVESGHDKETEHAERLARMIIPGDPLSEKLQKRLEAHGGESAFEEALGKFMEGEGAVPFLADGKTPTLPFRNNTEWRAFMANLLGIDGQEVEAQKLLEHLESALFRGTFQKTDAGPHVMVSDLAFAENGESVEYKFSQVPLNDQQKAQLLSKLKPGDTLTPELLKAAFGDKINFLQLVHAIATATLTDEQRAEILKAFRQQSDPRAQRDLEKALNDERKRRLEEDEEELGQRPPPPPFGYAGNQFDRKERYLDRHRFGIYVIFAVALVVTLITVMVLLRGL